MTHFPGNPLEECSVLSGTSCSSVVKGNAHRLTGPLGRAGTPRATTSKPRAHHSANGKAPETLRDLQHLFPAAGKLMAHGCSDMERGGPTEPPGIILSKIYLLLCPERPTATFPLSRVCPHHHLWPGPSVTPLPSLCPPQGDVGGRCAAPSPRPTRLSRKQSKRS